MLILEPLTEVELLAMIDRIDCRLSPENLYQDGERSHAEAQRAAKQLYRERAALETKLGRKVPYNG